MQHFNPVANVRNLIESISGVSFVGFYHHPKRYSPFNYSDRLSATLNKIASALLLRLMRSSHQVTADLIKILLHDQRLTVNDYTKRGIYSRNGIFLFHFLRFIVVYLLQLERSSSSRWSHKIIDDACKYTRFGIVFKFLLFLSRKSYETF